MLEKYQKNIDSNNHTLPPPTEINRGFWWYKLKQLTMTSFATYRLVNQKGKGYKGLYKKLFNLLNKDCIFTECYQENEDTFDGDDMIVKTTWRYEGKLPKGIVEEK